MTDALVAIVTGGAQGLGAAICSALLKNGYKVCVADVQEQKGNQFVEEQQKIYGKTNVIFSLCDVTKESDYKSTFDLTLKEFKKIDVVVNNAGIVLENDPKKTFDINTMGPMIGCQLALKYIGKSNGGKGGVVINTASILGLLPYSAMPAYTASKHAVIGLTRSFGLPYHLERDGIIFAAICPSFTQTAILNSVTSNCLRKVDISDRTDIMTPEYVAQGVLKLLEDRINGSTLLVTKQRGFQYIGFQEELKDISLE